MDHILKCVFVGSLSFVRRLLRNLKVNPQSAGNGPARDSNGLQKSPAAFQEGKLCFHGDLCDKPLTLYAQGLRISREESVKRFIEYPKE
jgi:hypothetical protein